MKRRVTLHLPRPCLMRMADGRLVMEADWTQADVIAAMRDLAEHIRPEPNWQEQFVEGVKHG